MQDMQEVLGFFDVMGSANAVSIVTGTHENKPSWFNINLGASGDTTSLDNMEASLAIASRTNELRAQEAQREDIALQEQKISNYAMALTQVRINKARYATGHPDKDNNHQLVYPMGSWSSKLVIHRCSLRI